MSCTIMHALFSVDCSTRSEVASGALLFRAAAWKVFHLNTFPHKLVAKSAC